MKKITLKTRSPEDKDFERMAAYLSWAEQLLEEKIAKYHYGHVFDGDGYEIVEEREKAVKINVDVYQKFGDEHSDVWQIWMPKACFYEFDK